MIVYDIPQHLDDGSANPEWLDLRRGIPTASNAEKILTPTGKLSAQAWVYVNSLLADLAGFGDDPIEANEWMLRGIELEEEARDLFAFERGLAVNQVGFVTNDEGTAGCSPDGIAEIDTGQVGFEAKCPKASTHFGYLRKGELPAKYKPQVHWSMAVTGLRSWYFMSYFPGLDPLIVLVHADDYTQKVTEAMNEFTASLAKEVARFGINKLEKAA